jgi:hypothetical protein
MLNTAAVHFHVIVVGTALLEGLVDRPGSTTRDRIQKVSMTMNGNEARCETNEETQHRFHR